MRILSWWPLSAVIESQHSQMFEQHIPTAGSIVGNHSISHLMQPVACGRKWKEPATWVTLRELSRYRPQFHTKFLIRNLMPCGQNALCTCALGLQCAVYLCIGIAINFRGLPQVFFFCYSGNIASFFVYMYNRNPGSAFVRF